MFFKTLNFKHKIKEKFSKNSTFIYKRYNVKVANKFKSILKKISTDSSV